MTSLNYSSHTHFKFIDKYIVIVCLYLEMRVDFLLQVNTLKYYSEWTNVETLRKDKPPSFYWWWISYSKVFKCL